MLTSAFRSIRNRFARLARPGADGLTRVSAATWLAVELTESGAPAPALFEQGGAADILLFSSDVPAMNVVRSDYGVSATVGGSGVQDLYVEGNFMPEGLTFRELVYLNDVPLGTALSVTEAPSAIGEATVCTVNGVTGLKGALLSVLIADRKLENAETGGDGCVPSLNGDFVCNGSGAAGVPFTPFQVSTDAQFFGSIILKSSQYTQAIRDAGNVIEYDNGGFLHVIGVFESVSGG